MLNNIGWDGRLHRWRGSKTCSQAYLSEAGSLQIFSLWVVHLVFVILYNQRGECAIGKRSTRNFIRVQGL